jgi:hypothetical protein
MLGLLQLLAVLVVMALVPDDLAQWLFCTPLAVAGIALSFVWQFRASKPSV